ncbi:MAG TPA: crosslink repair DNA glycosylase YcaQ family protein [Chitinophagales bacterium]|nr:crosslink repair DNA glycosylase YcaQ family protein [Chitinophagales bacterium]
MAGLKHKPPALSNTQARHLILTCQGLNHNFFGSGRQGAQKVIEHLGYVQIDTISVVERAHHHTIWARANDYKKSYLDELIEKDKTVFEYWSHAAAYLPMRDFRYSLIRKNLWASGKIKWFRNKRMTQFVLDRITAEGPLQSKDFEATKPRGGWWEWKDTKRALEQLFMEGRLMAKTRSGFQKVYDLTERVLPKNVNTQTPTPEEYAAYLVRKTIRANGLAAADEIGYLRKNIKKPVNAALDVLLESGEIIPVMVEGYGTATCYTTTANLELADRAQKNSSIHILSPFDNGVIQRRRLKKVFGFDYTIECYLPEHKRKYGYFCLPVLYADKFIARIDCKADRKEGVLYVKTSHYENKPSAAAKKALGNALVKFAAFNGCKTVK